VHVGESSAEGEDADDKSNDDDNQNW